MEIKSAHLSEPELVTLREKAARWNTTGRNDPYISPLWDEQAQSAVQWRDGVIVAPADSEVVYVPVLVEMDADEMDQL